MKPIVKKLRSSNLFIKTFVPLLVLTVVACISSIIISLELVNSSAKAQALQAVEKLSIQVNATFAPDVLNVENFANAAAHKYDKEFLSDVIKSLAPKLVYATSIYYSTDISRFNDGGFYIDSSDWEPEEDWEPSTTNWYKETVAQNGEIAYLEPEIDEMTGEQTITFSKAIYDEKKSLLGVVAVDLTLEALTELSKSVNLSPNSVVYILQKDGTYLTNDDVSKQLTSSYLDEPQMIELEVNAENYLDGNKKVILSKGHFYCVNPIEGTPWFVVADGPISDFSHGLYLKILVVLAILLLFAGLGALFNTFTMKMLRKKDLSNGEKIYFEAQNLATSIKETLQTSQSQSAAVKEIVSTMEDTNELSSNINVKIKDVAKLAKNTSVDVNSGFSALEANVTKLHEISISNTSTIEGIKSLGLKIENIWDIVSLINSVADQAKIIAFNAELEASKAGEAGKNFHIVATEIRRLADGIIEGTKEIKEQISEIQQSSDSLILLSESGTEKINQGCDQAKILEQNFQRIHTSSEVTATASEDIMTIIQHQVVASEQILLTLKKISNGTENFYRETENISNSAEKLREIAENISGTESKRPDYF